MPVKQSERIITSADACPYLSGGVDEALSREWLLTNSLGGYASGTVIGSATRRYHGLLVASKRPPLERVVLWANTLEQLIVGNEVFEFPSFEFSDALHPTGHLRQTDFSYSTRQPIPWARFTYRIRPRCQAGSGNGGEHITFVKTLQLAEGCNVVRLVYEIHAPAEVEFAFNILPFLAGRDFHAVLRADGDSGWTHSSDDGWEAFRRRDAGAVTLFLRGMLQASAGDPPTSTDVSYEPTEDRWYGFHYRQEAARGLDYREDLFAPGWFRTTSRGSFTMVLDGVGLATDAADANRVMQRAEARGNGKPQTAWENSFPSHARKEAIAPDCKNPLPHGRGSDRRGSDRCPASHTPPEIDSGIAASAIDESAARSPDAHLARLRDAAAQFVVARESATGRCSTTILAGYPWFGDWGRDTFIALPGLLLATGRFDEAREVLVTFASARRNGLIPNRFDDYDGGCHYNSIDASLWFLRAADAYLEASGDWETWREHLLPACIETIVAFETGTDFDTGVDRDGLLRCGNPETQITWMDAKHGDVVFTPRYGKPVEINALWYHGLRALSKRLTAAGDERAKGVANSAARVRASFESAFWNASVGGLFDCVRADGADASIRPNQIFAVSLEHSPLSDRCRRQVVSCVRSHLLTPYGLRTLCPEDSRYRGRYEGGPFERDGAYHQGTVWPWLLGPFVEAYLRVEEFSAEARQQGRQWLMPLLDHFDEAGLGTVSEVYDGDAPHRPNGCIAQAWSVAELLRATLLTSERSPGEYGNG